MLPAMELGVALPAATGDKKPRCVGAGRPLALVNLPPVMARSSGSAVVRVALLDGPVSTGHPDLTGAHIHPVSAYAGVACTLDRSSACSHGTFIAGILAARRDSRAPAIC